jgi:hypothetical protein
VRVDDASGYLRFERGGSFIPIGENLCWPPSFEPLKAYDRWFRELAAQRANYIRMWMAPWAFRLETKDTGSGRYDQLRAWQLDHLLAQSQAHGLYWQLCLLNHGSFSRSQDPDWQNNPYNQDLGGMCRLPNDFLTHFGAKDTFRRLLRYIVSRWGYSPNLVAWELFNEPDLSELRMEDFSSWALEMSAFLRKIDLHQRPITTSFHHASPKAVWEAPTIDIIQLHTYDQRDFAAKFGDVTIADLRETFHKPVMVGEFGWISDVMRKFDDSGIHLHDGLWSSVMNGAAGGALVWYWDTYVHPNRLQRHFKPLAIFLRGERLGAGVKRLQLSLSDAGLVGWGIGSRGRAYFWIKNRAHTLDEYIGYRSELTKQRMRRARGETTQSQKPAYPSTIVRGARATLHGLDWLARYRVEWWDTYRGRVTSRSVEQSRWGDLIVEVPDVKFDIAGKLIKLAWWERG